MGKGLFDNDFYITRVILACFVKSGTGAPIHRNRSSHGFAYNLRGSIEYTFDNGNTVIVGENELIYLPLGSNYTVRENPVGDCYAINFQLSEPIQAEPFKLYLKPTDVLNSFKHAEQAFRRQQIGYKQICCKELYNISYYILQSQNNTGYASAGQKMLVRRAEEYIADHCTEHISLSALAKHCEVSEVYLRKIFKAVHKKSPINYINDMRLSYAHAMLVSGEYSVTQICFMSGFNDLSYFSRAYKSKYGTSPRQTEI